MFDELMESAKASLNSIFGGKTTDREAVVKIEDASFRKLLPYFSYDAENDLYINKQTAGIALEVRGYYGADAETLKSFLQYLDKVLPGGQEFHMQCLRLTSHEIYDRLIEIEKASSIKGGLYAEFARYNTRYMTMVAKKGIASRGGYPISLYDTRVFAFISVKYKDKNLDEKIEHLKAIQREALNSKMVKSLPVDAFMALMQTLLNPYPGRVQGEVCRYNDLESISSQLCKSGWSLKQEYDRLKFRFLEHPNHYPNRVHSEVVAMGIESFPDKFYLWNMPECFASIRNQHLAISCPHFYTVSFQFMKAFQAQTKATRKVHSDEKNAKSAGFSKYVLNKRREFEEWTMLQGLLKESQINITLSEFTSSLVLMTTAKDRLRDIKNTQDIFTAAGFNIGPKDGIQLFQYLSALPFMAGEGYFDDAKKLGLRRSMTSFNVANLLPIITDWPGCRSGLIMPTPRNQFSAVDVFSDDMGIADTNMVVGAVPGSGKSVLMQAFLRQVLSQKGGRAWIIDRGNSYKKTCDILGGVYIDKESLNLNPFTFLPVDDTEKLGKLNDALIGVRDLLANMAEPNGSLSEVQIQFLYDAVKLVYQRKKNDGTIDDVCKVLLEKYDMEQDQRLKDLSIVLTKYTADQPYGKYFKEGSQLDPEQNLIVVELGDFDQTPDLQKVILCALVNHISKEMYLTGRDVPKMCIIDEAWKFLDGSNPMTSSLIETGFRTSRKHRGSFTVVTQDFDVFFDKEKPLARTAYNCSSISIIMRQKTSRFKSFCNENEGVFTAYEQQIIENFQEAREAGFSSFCLKTNGYTSFHRLVVDPLSRIMFSTEATEYQAVENLIQKGYSTFNAVYEVAKVRFPEEMSLLEEPNVVSVKPVMPYPLIYSKALSFLLFSGAIESLNPGLALAMLWCCCAYLREASK